MTLKQSELEHLKHRFEKGELTVDEANVEMVRMQRVQLVTRPLPAAVRNSFRGAVKRGELARMPKDGRKPEAFYHPTFEYLAHAERAAHERRMLEALAGIVARSGEAF